MSCTTADIEYQADGRTMVGRLALPDGDESRPGVLIAHEGNGLDDFQKARPERFAEELGCVAFALDYHGGGKPLADRTAINDRLGELMDDADRTRALGQAGLDILLSQPRVDPARVAAVGYCFGGTLVLELARAGADLKAVVGFHPGLATTRPEDSANIRGTVLMLVGADDPIVPATERSAFEEEMRRAGVDWRLYVFGGAQHTFTHPRAGMAEVPGLAYHEATDRRSKRAMVDLFDEVLS